MKKFSIFILALVLILVGCSKEKPLKTGTLEKENEKTVIELYGKDNTVSKIVLSKTQSNMKDNEIKQLKESYEAEKKKLANLKYAEIDQKIEGNKVTMIVTMNVDTKENREALIKEGGLPGVIKAENPISINLIVAGFEMAGFKFK